MTKQTINSDAVPTTYKQGDYFISERGKLLRLCQVVAGKAALISEDGNRCLDGITVGHIERVTVEEVSRMTDRTLTPVKTIAITYTV